MVNAVVEPERLIFVDECGTHTSLAPIYGYAPRGHRLYLSVPRSRGKNTTLLSSMTTDGMGPSLTVEVATTARVFETYVEKVLLTSLEPGQIVVMDIHEQFMTETALMADLVLPATMFMEHDDLYQGGGHQYLQLGPKLVDPP